MPLFTVKKKAATFFINLLFNCFIMYFYYFRDLFQA